MAFLMTSFLCYKNFNIVQNKIAFISVLLSLRFILFSMIFGSLLAHSRFSSNTLKVSHKHIYLGSKNTFSDGYPTDISPDYDSSITPRDPNNKSFRLPTTLRNTNVPVGFTKDNVQALKVKTGAFIRQWPTVYPGPIHFKRAFRQIKTIKVDRTIKNLKNAQKKLSAQQLDALMKGLTVPITDILQLYHRDFKQLHPYEAIVANLTLTARVKKGHEDLQTVTTNLKSLRANTSRIAKEFAGLASNATTSAEAKDLLSEGISRLENLYNNSRDALALEELAEIHKDLRRIPVIELHLPTVVLVGSPNVGKSSIVRAVSSGTPEVNDYPFTTRGVTIGHVAPLHWADKPEAPLRCQVMDTPGLLNRPEEERNEMERLTFASLAHLPTGVVFVVDASGLSGEQSSLAAQLAVRRYLKSRFPKRPWVDVLSKGDIPLSSETKALLDFEYLPVSVKEGTNIDILKIKIDEMLHELYKMLRSS